MNYSLYFHIPFCKQRCHYCDFITTTGKEGMISNYFHGLAGEIRIVLSLSEQKFPIHSIYFGGGTPSLVTIPQYEMLLSEIALQFTVMDNCEISIEANPGSVTKDYLKGLKTLGFNRISFGVQSTDSFDLARLDRIHNIDDILNSYYYARNAGFDNINLDLIFDLPWQDLASWENSLKRAISLNPEHFSLYSLIIEPGTPLWQWHQKGLIGMQEEDTAADMFERSMELMEQAGYTHYEISNWAKVGENEDFRCKHNLQYWLNQPYFGFGAGAHGYVSGTRTINTRSLVDYIHQMQEWNPDVLAFPLSPATVSSSKINETTKMKEFMMLGLRLIEGVSDRRFNSLYGCSMLDVFGDEIELLENKGLLHWDTNKEEFLRLTKRGVMVANQVFLEFV